jgi:hypothetical protein
MSTVARQRHYRIDTGNRHQAPAHLISRTMASNRRCRMMICSRNTRRTMSIGSTSLIQPWQATQPAAITRARRTKIAHYSKDNIYGFVVAKIGDRGAAELNTAIARIKELTDKYCPDHPNDKFVGR